MTADRMPAGDLLQATGISRHFGGIYAVEDASLQLRPGRLVGLIGPNGAGKSTMLNCLSGIDLPNAGQVRLGDHDVTRWPMHERARHGVGRTFQLSRLFASLSVRENVALALESTLLSRAAGGSSRHRGLSRAAVRDRSATALQRVGLTAIAERNVAALPVGQKRLVEMARLIAMDFEVLLLDEPAAGLNAGEGDQLFALIRELADEGKGVLLVEHRIRSVVAVVDRLIVMDHGRVIADGDADTVMALAQVQEAYMGLKAHAQA